jgi:hypothetical protein
VTPTIEIRERRTGNVLTSMPLYEFLAQSHAALPASDYFQFEELDIRVNGEELLPEPQGNA